MSNKRIADELDKVFLKRETLVGIRLKLKNRRVTLCTDGEQYSLHFKSLTQDGKIGKMSLALSKEAMLAVVILYNELDGPLPDGVEKL